jgi:Holliday junction resolvasome RuvABC endonuclease subunit
MAKRKQTKKKSNAVLAKTNIKFPITYTEGKHGFLLVDPSSSHLAWVLVQLDLDAKEMYVVATGMLWTKDSWSKAQRYRYMLKAAGILLDGTDHIIPHVVVTESFFMNPKLPMGSAVVPTINALISMAADEKEVIYQELGPSAWRAILGIKSVTVGSKRDYKIPTANYVKKFISVPENIKSNINLKERQLPHDITDALAIALAVAKHHGVYKIEVANTAFTPFTVLEKLSKLGETI